MITLKSPKRPYTNRDEKDDVSFVLTVVATYTLNRVSLACVMS